MNKVFMMGRITHDLDLRITPNGISVLKFQIAVDRNYQKSGEEKKTDFFNVCAWRQTAEFIARHFGKGRLILIEGELQTSSYTDKNGNNSTGYEIVVDEAHFTGEKKDDNSVANRQAAPQQTTQQTQHTPNHQAQDGSPGQNMPAQSAQDKDDYPF